MLLVLHSLPCFKQHYGLMSAIKEQELRGGNWEKCQWENTLEKAMHLEQHTHTLRITSQTIKTWYQRKQVEKVAQEINFFSRTIYLVSRLYQIREPYTKPLRHTAQIFLVWIRSRMAGKNLHAWYPLEHVGSLRLSGAPGSYQDTTKCFGSPIL